MHVGKYSPDAGFMVLYHGGIRKNHLRQTWNPSIDSCISKVLLGTIGFSRDS